MIGEDEGGAGLDLEPGASAAELARGQSILDKVTSNREERADDELWLDIPSWAGELKARYVVVDRPELEKMVRRMRFQQGPKSNQASVADVDFLIKACVEVKAHDNDTEEEAKVSDGFTTELAEKLGSKPGTDSARGLVTYLFKGNGIAIGAHAVKVAKWMQDTTAPVEDPQ